MCFTFTATAKNQKFCGHPKISSSVENSSLGLMAKCENF
jgi:hypothetical protein